MKIKVILREHVSSKINEAVLLLLSAFSLNCAPAMNSSTQFVRVKQDTSWGHAAVGTVEDNWLDKPRNVLGLLDHAEGRQLPTRQPSPFLSVAAVSSVSKWGVSRSKPLGYLRLWALPRSHRGRFTSSAGD